MNKSLVLVVLLIAFYLRVVALDTIPNGWRDDEVIETTVHAQLILDGQYPLYFTQAAGQEPVYHYLAALFMGTMGKSLFVVRLVSAALGLLTVATAYRLAKQFFGSRYALIVSLLIAVSFWALMWSRTKVRPIAELPLMLLGMSFLFKAFSSQRSAISKTVVLAGITLGIALYTYFASLTIPLILLLFAFYFLLFKNSHWRTTLLILLIALIVYAPLGWAIFSNARASEGMRLNTIADPLIALTKGDPQYIIRNTFTTLQMFITTGDPEWQSNMAGRPVFNLVGFGFFIMGVVISLWRFKDKRYAFLLIWLLTGLAPAFASVPAASLSHTITALPVTYLIASLPIVFFSPQKVINPVIPSPARARNLWGSLRDSSSQKTLLGMTLAGGLIFAIALRDLPDYFFNWHTLPQVRYLYKSELHEQAQKLKNAPSQTYVLNGVLNIWDRKAFLLEPLKFSSPPRWVRKGWAMIFPNEPTMFLFDLGEWKNVAPQHAQRVEFTNGLVFLGWDEKKGDVVTYWLVSDGYTFKEPRVGASPESPIFPIMFFVHLVNEPGAVVEGSDRIDVDIFVLQAGDKFLQRHEFKARGSFELRLGVYDPRTGQRYKTKDGLEMIEAGKLKMGD